MSEEALGHSSLDKAMLFELSVARTEQLVAGRLKPNWDECLELAIRRQRRHFDAQIPASLGQSDIDLITLAAKNLFVMLRDSRSERPHHDLLIAPPVPGFGWVASGSADFSRGSLLIEVKHTDRNFGAGDFRQVLMYWLLKYANTIERDDLAWSDCLLLNPRRNIVLKINFDNLIRLASGGMSRVEVYEQMREVFVEDVWRRG
jgi:hypothetical protein